MLAVALGALPFAATAQTVRLDAIDERLARSDMAGAADLLARVSTVDDMLTLITLRRYDPLIGEQDRLALLTRAIAQEDRRTAEAAERSPQDLRVVLDRATFLLGQARNRDAYVLLEPFARDIPATVRRAEEGVFLVNYAAYALLKLGRPNEGVALSAALSAIPITDTPALISARINHSSMLRHVGRNADSLAHATGLNNQIAQYATAYGRMWILSNAICAMERLDRRDEINSLLRRLWRGRDDNPEALTRAYLCMGDLDAAEELIVRRLRAGDADARRLVRSFQTYQLGGSIDDVVEGRFAEIRDRPAVRAALDRVGRILSLPLDGTYWRRT